MCFGRHVVQLKERARGLCQVSVVRGEGCGAPAPPPPPPTTPSPLSLNPPSPSFDLHLHYPGAILNYVIVLGTIFYFHGFPKFNFYFNRDKADCNALDPISVNFLSIILII